MKPHLVRDGRGIVRGSDDRQYQAGRELGLCSMVNPSASLRAGYM
jgi:hypothetical protein